MESKVSTRVFWSLKAINCFRNRYKIEYSVILAELEKSEMTRFVALIFPVVLFIPAVTQAQQDETYDYWQHQREMVRSGQHAVFMCNGLFTSNRSLEQLYEWELEFFETPIGNPNGGNYRVDTERKLSLIHI